MIKGLYIHIPFCHYKCPYCDFVSFTNDFPYELYLKYILQEANLYKDVDMDIKTIYLGGGTPSILDTKLYRSFLAQLSKVFDTSGVEEISIECNPEDYRENDFKALLDVGFTRISIGVQSFTEKGLLNLGRNHSPKESIESVHSAYKAGFDNINVDIIYGYPHQTLEDLKKDLEMVSSLPVKHVSFYLLTPYEDTLFGELFQKKMLKIPEEKEIEEMFLLIHESMEDLGFEHYEVSNYAIEGYQCKHNLIYWNQEEFLGLGVSAWSFYENLRFGNVRNLSVYMETLRKGEKPVAYEEKLEGLELLKDYVFLKLRTSEGIPKLKEIPWDKVFEELGEFLIDEGERVALNPKGMLLINEVLLRLFKLIEHPHVV